MGPETVGSANSSPSPSLPPSLHCLPFLPRAGRLAGQASSVSLRVPVGARGPREGSLGAHAKRQGDSPCLRSRRAQRSVREARTQGTGPGPGGGGLGVT